MGKNSISSQAISEYTNVNPTQIRRDLSGFGKFGKRGVGYDIDSLIEQVISSNSRKDLDIAGRALDRVLRAEHFWVPNWHKASHWIAHWDRYGRPAIKPKYDRGIVDTWWYDTAKGN